MMIEQVVGLSLIAIVLLSWLIIEIAVKYRYRRQRAVTQAEEIKTEFNNRRNPCPEKELDSWIPEHLQQMMRDIEADYDRYLHPPMLIKKPPPQPWNEASLRKALREQNERIKWDEMREKFDGI